MPDTDITRRQALGAAGTGVALLFAGSRASLLPLGDDVAEAASATCTMTPAKTEGPYFVDEKLNRSSIVDGQAGTPLALTMYVFDASNDCAPVAGATVDIWHANASGEYSDVSQNGTVGSTWLRGYQVTDADGKVVFHTIWPGWYTGRAVHIHFKVRKDGLEFTSQMFFTDEMNARVFASAPYASRGEPDVTDGEDNILAGDAETLTLAPVASGDGYAADFSVGLSSGSSSTDSEVSAVLRSARIVRLASGRRQVRVRLRPSETVTVVARLSRAGRRLAYRRTTLDAGSHLLRLNLGSSVRAGAARLTLRLKDSAGNTKTMRRSLHVPKRRKR